MFAELAKIVAKTNGLWNAEAEKYLLEPRTGHLKTEKTETERISCGECALFMQ